MFRENSRIASFLVGQMTGLANSNLEAGQGEPRQDPSGDSIGKFRMSSDIDF